MSEADVWIVLVGAFVAAYGLIGYAWLSTGRSLRRRMELQSVQDDLRRIDRRIDELDRRLRTSAHRAP